MRDFETFLKDSLTNARLQALEEFLKEKFPDAEERLRELMLEAAAPKTRRVE